MQMQGQAKRVTIYVGESDHFRGMSLYIAILQFLRREGAAGATVTRAIAGYGAKSRIHTAMIETLSFDLPIKIEWVDLPSRVERLLPRVRRMVNDGLIVVESVDVVQYSVGRSQDPLRQPVHNIMRDEVVSVQAQTPVAELVTLLLHRGVRCLPVVDPDLSVVGIITDSDLLRRAGLLSRLGLQPTLTADQIHKQLEILNQSQATAADIMSRPVVTALASEPVHSAVAKMVKHEVKRLPVVDDVGQLAGMISRVDVFRAVEYQQAETAPDEEAPQRGSTVMELMHTDVPTVLPEANLEEILQALEQDRRRRAVVVDAEGHIKGIITDGDLLRRSQQARLPGLVSRLRGLITGYVEETPVLPDVNERASDLMTAPVITVRTERSIAEALHLMTEYGVKRLPVVDAEDRLVGILGRASVLRALWEQGTPQSVEAPE